MRPAFHAVILFTAFLLFGSSNAQALTALRGDEAKNYLGDVKAHLLSGKYTFDILGRSHRDAMHARFSDGVVFSAGEGKFRFPRRKDGDYVIVINAPNGREEEPVNTDTWLKKIQNALADDNRNPYIFLDDAKKEIALVFVGNGTQVNAKINDEGLLGISLTTPGAKGR